jgi:calpain-15
MDLFTNKEYSSDGAFEIHFYIRGEKVSVIIDDRLAVINYGEEYQNPLELINSRPSPNGAWWLVLMEKAYAKLNVNYTQLDAGGVGEALRSLTGQPVTEHQTANMTDDQIWSIVTKETRE